MLRTEIRIDTIDTAFGVRVITMAIICMMDWQVRGRVGGLVKWKNRVGLGMARGKSNLGNGLSQCFHEEPTVLVHLLSQESFHGTFCRVGIESAGRETKLPC